MTPDIILAALALGATAPSSTAGIITDFTSGTTALALLITAFLGLRPLLKRQARTEKVLDQIHTLTNQLHTDDLRFIGALEAALVNAGVPVPVNQAMYATSPQGPSAALDNPPDTPQSHRA